MRKSAKGLMAGCEVLFRAWGRVGVVLLGLGILSPRAARADLVIDGRFVGGTPPTNMVGRGSLQQIFKVAALTWQNAFKSPTDKWTVHVDYGWNALGQPAQFSMAPGDQGGTPHRILRCKILFNNKGTTPFFADLTPLGDAEYRSYTNASLTYQDMELNIGRVWTNPVNQAVGRLDLLSTVLHELGHALGLAASNTASAYYPVVTCPRPFAGYTIFSDGNQLTEQPDSALFKVQQPGKRYRLSALDVLAVAEVSKFDYPNLDPYVNPAPRLGLARVFVAKKIITMDPARPEATAVGVADGRIIAVGTPMEVVAAMTGRQFVMDYTFACEVMVPDFVEGHSHFQGYGLYSRVPYLGYFDRPTPEGGVLTGVKTYAALVARLKQAVQQQVLLKRNTKLPVLAFGADPIFYPTEIPTKHLTAAMLDEVSKETPIFLPLLSGHVVACNSAMLALVKQQPEWAKLKETSGVVKDALGEPTGEFDEIAATAMAFAAFQKKDPTFFPSRGYQALLDAGQLAKRAGITTATDLAFGGEPRPTEALARGLYVLACAREDFPVRVVLGYFVDQLNNNWGTNAVEHMRKMRAADKNKLRTGPVKIITDGSIQGYTAQLQPPGFLFPDDANGIWNVEPGLPLFNLCKPFWQAGIQIAVHVNGDEASEQMLDVLEELELQYPQLDHRFSLQHNQVSRTNQFARMARLGATVNLFCNHLYYYGDQHCHITLGPERASQMDSPAMAKAAGVPFSLHSDAPVTPMQPLTAMWCAVNRVTASGRVLDTAGESQKISVQDALHAVTLGGAYLLKLEDEIGSIKAGKRADFAVLGQDPYAVEPLAIKDIPVRATVFDGTAFPVK